MSQLNYSVTTEDFDAVLFDLDGVLTATAKVHAVSWKRMFDEFLSRYCQDNNESFVPFEIDTDYKYYVDGKPRLEGVRSFLKVRGIKLLDGSPDTTIESDTVYSLGKRKDEIFHSILKTDGVEVYETSVAWVCYLRSQEIKIAVVSSIRNCEAVLKAAGITDLFDVRVDGKVAATLGIAGKPAPDTYLKAAQMLDVEPKRCVVVEDAVSGVQAGRAGNFGLVIGVNRNDDADALIENGADIVVTDLCEMLQ
ncbi:MAG: beta-phosphoglucomutase family hydrolase [Rivularia sp. ALOHA_DT_140]|nr:beta-phosphoglucomutase family hydrolase [Rivularia sp. ALOHA_DT_140]